jgi:hypothetical protein
VDSCLIVKIQFKIGDVLYGSRQDGKAEGGGSHDIV